MSGGEIFGIIISVATAWGCAGTFLGIGIWSLKRKTPMHFWAGSTIDPKTVTDIPAYNRANARMWMEYSMDDMVPAMGGAYDVYVLTNDRFHS